MLEAQGMALVGGGGGAGGIRWPAACCNGAGASGCAVSVGLLCCRQGAFAAGSGAFSVGLHAGSLIAGLLADLDLAADGVSFGLPTAGSFGFSAGLTTAACGAWKLVPMYVTLTLSWDKGS